MFGPFKLKSTLSRNNSVDQDDTLRTKYALQGIGYYKPPKHGISKYPDEEMFKSIKRFQSDLGLKKDRVMKPGGESERTLRAVTNAVEERFLTGPFVSTVAIADTAIFVNSAVIVGSVVLGVGPGEFTKNGK